MHRQKLDPDRMDFVLHQQHHSREDTQKPF